MPYRVNEPEKDLSGMITAADRSFCLYRDNVYR